MANEVVSDSAQSQFSATPTTRNLTPLSPEDNLPARSKTQFWIRTLIAVGIVAAIGLAAYFLQSSDSWSKSKLAMTHTVQRGDLVVTVLEQGRLESSENTEIKCKVRGQNTITWVIEGGMHVEEGEELVRLDTLAIEEAISERTKFALWSRSGAERSKADVTRGELAINEYLEGRYRSELMSLEKDLAIAKSNLRSAQDWYRYTRLKANRKFTGPFEVEERRLTVTQAELDVKLKETEINVLKQFTKNEQLETLKGDLASTKATHAANVERAMADATRRDRALEEFEYCVIKAPRSGLVIYPSAARWKGSPDIEEGASVHKDQVLLLMPDLSQMQVKVGVHESVIKRVSPGVAANITVPGKSISAKVTSVATVTQPAGWWTGNVVKYDTVIKLPPNKGLKPGMSAEVELVLAEYKDVLLLPVASVVETEKGSYCWVQNEEGLQKRLVELGDSDDVFVHVKDGVLEGEQVVLNPLDLVDEAQLEELRPIDKNDKRSDSEPSDENGESKTSGVKKIDSGKDSDSQPAKETQTKLEKVDPKASKPKTPKVKKPSKETAVKP